MVVDFGTHSADSTDYPLWIIPTAEAVAKGEERASFWVVRQWRGYRSEQGEGHSLRTLLERRNSGTFAPT